MPSATAQQGVNYGTAFTSFGMAYEQPVLFAKCAGPNCVLDEVVVDLQRAVLDEPVQGFPAFQRIPARQTGRGYANGSGTGGVALRRLGRVKRRSDLASQQR